MIEDSKPCDCHLACDCREGLFSKAMTTQKRVAEILALDDNGLMRELGELSEGEIRAVRRALNGICGGKK